MCNVDGCVRFVQPAWVDEVLGAIAYAYEGVVRVIPLVHATASHGGCSYRVRCPYCCRRHTHGRLEGTRVAGCSSDDQQRIYYVRPRRSHLPYLGLGEVRDTASRREG